jgi:hypothetical protein
MVLLKCLSNDLLSLFVQQSFAIYLIIQYCAITLWSMGYVTYSESFVALKACKMRALVEATTDLRPRAGGNDCRPRLASWFVMSASGWCSCFRLRLLFRWILQLALALLLLFSTSECETMAASFVTRCDVVEKVWGVTYKHAARKDPIRFLGQPHLRSREQRLVIMSIRSY